MNLKEYIFSCLPASQQDFLFSLKRFHFGKRKFPEKQILIMKVDGKHFHGGLADRLKGMISLYHYCLIKGIGFRISHIYPFELSDYLLPNEYDWQIKDSDNITLHLLESKYFHLVGDGSIKRLAKLKTGKQIHCYANRDYVELLNEHYNTDFDWKFLFKKLFKPAPEIQQQIDYHKQQIGGKFIACQFRFLALLGDFNEYDDAALPKEEQQILIEKCLKTLAELKAKHNLPILVTSDSATFTSLAQKLDGIYVLQSKPVHFDCVEDVNAHNYIDTFIDFFMLSEAQKTYNVFTKEMYKSEFSLYASKLNNVPFERIFIE